MRGFAQTLFNVLLGWIRTVVEGVWSLLFDNGTQAWLQWIAGNWLALVVLLCLAGVFVDYFVWFLRWRPYYVWATSIRHLKRFFSGRRGREDKVREQPLPPPAPAREDAPVGRQAGPAQPYPQEPPAQTVRYGQETPEVPGWMDTPTPAAETIFARPKKTDYQEQYVRRFSRPEPEQPPEPAYEEPPEYVAEPAAGYEEYQENGLGDAAQEEWLPEAPPVPEDLPLHPGIDYQALSRQYGWHPGTAERPALQADPPAKAAREQSGPAWDFSGLRSFSPYNAPAPAAAKGQRSQRAQKVREDATPLSRMKTGLKQIAQKAGKALTVDDDEESKLLDGLPPPIDKRRAFHAPVYPNRQGEDRGKSPDFREDD